MLFTLTGNVQTHKATQVESAQSEMVALTSQQHLVLHQVAVAAILALHLAATCWMQHLNIVSGMLRLLGRKRSAADSAGTNLSAGAHVQAVCGPTACVYVALHAMFNLICSMLALMPFMNQKDAVQRVLALFTTFVRRGRPSALPSTGPVLDEAQRQSSTGASSQSPSHATSHINRDGFLSSSAQATAAVQPVGSTHGPVGTAHAVHSAAGMLSTQAAVLSIHLPLLAYVLAPAVMIQRGFSASPTVLGAATACMMLAIVLLSNSYGGRGDSQAHADGVAQGHGSQAAITGPAAHKEAATIRSAAPAGPDTGPEAEETLHATVLPTATLGHATHPQPGASQTGQAPADAAAFSPHTSRQDLQAVAGKLLAYGSLSSVCASALQQRWPLVVYGAYAAIDAIGIVTTVFFQHEAGALYGTG